MSLINDALKRAEADKLNAGVAAGATAAPFAAVSSPQPQNARCGGRDASGPPVQTPAGDGNSIPRFAKVNGVARVPGATQHEIPAGDERTAGCRARDVCGHANGKSRHIWLLLAGAGAIIGALGYRFYNADAARPQAAIGQVQPEPDWIIIKPADSDASLPSTPGVRGADQRQTAQTADTPQGAPAGGQNVGANPWQPQAANSSASSQTRAAKINQNAPAPPAGAAAPPDAPGPGVDANGNGDVVLEDLTPASRRPGDSTPRDNGSRLPDGAPSVPAPAGAAPTAQPNSPAQLKLDGIIFGPDGGAAIISGKSLRIGQEICGAKVVKITRSQVELDFHGQAITLRL